MTGVELIAQERQRQLEVEGWTAEHDQQWLKGELAIAAACYAVYGTVVEVLKITAGLGSRGFAYKDGWPWDSSWDKRYEHNLLRRLAIAGALCAAEIDRIKRMEGLND